MEEQQKVLTLLKEIKFILGHQKKVMNVEDLAAYTGLSKSKIYKLTSLKLIPMSNNKHIRQIFFDKDTIDKWLMGDPNLSDEFLEEKFNQQLQGNKNRWVYWCPLLQRKVFRFSRLREKRNSKRVMRKLRHHGCFRVFNKLKTR